MNYSKLKGQIAGVVLAAISFTACKKNDIIQPDPAAPVDSASIAELRIKRTGGSGTGTGAANTFYISTTGNDATGTGTISSPWKTLYKATSTVSTVGSIIHVNAGTYLETMQSALKPGVSIEGDGVSSVLKSTLTAAWTEVLSLKSPEGTNGNQHVSNLKFDGQNLSTFWGIYVAGRSNVSIHDITMVDYADRGVMFGGRNDNNEGAPGIYATGNSFYNNTVTNCAEYSSANGTYGRGCLNIGGQSGMLVYNNTISQTSRAIGHNGWPIKYFNGGYLNGCKIYNNTLNKIPQAGYPGTNGWDFAIELFNESGMEIYGNTITGGGIDMNYQTKGAYTYSTWIHDNTIKMAALNSNFQYAITLEFGSEDVLIENNIIDKQSSGIVFNPRTTNTVKNITIRKNLMSNIGINTKNGSFIYFGGEGNTGYFDNIQVYNNTMIGEPNNKNFWGIQLPNPVAGYARNISFKNNIVANTDAGWIVQANVPVRIDNLNISYNNCFGNMGNNAPVWNGTVATNYTLSNNLNVVPTFATYFYLSSGSPLIDAGVNVGIPFKGTKPDIGYFEF
jgi:hypothetical protein